MTTLKLTGLRKFRQHVQVIGIKHLELNDNGVYGIIGPNGAGKTTLLNCICGLLQPEAGRLTLNDIPLSVATRADYLTHIGTVLTQSDTIFDATVEALLQQHYFYFNLTPPAQWSTVLDQVDLHVQPDLKVGAMSLGMRQRLLVALALSHQPDLLILDEPFNGLDPDGINLLKQRIRNFAKTGIVLIASHNLADLADIVTSVTVMINGKLSPVQSTDQICQQYANGLSDYYQHQRTLKGQEALK